MKRNVTYNPCDDCCFSFSKNGQESNICRICEFNQLVGEKRSERTGEIKRQNRILAELRAMLPVNRPNEMVNIEDVIRERTISEIIQNINKIPIGGGENSESD